MPDCLSLHTISDNQPYVYFGIIRLKACHQNSNAR
jgi:hypothetical protein